MAIAAAAASADKKAFDIRVLDVGDLIGVTDFFVLISAGNERQLGTVVDEIHQQLKQRHGLAPRRREGARDTGWMLIDYGDIVVHVFTSEQREYYDLERLWSDAEAFTFELPSEAVSSVAAGHPAS